VLFIFKGLKAASGQKIEFDYPKHADAKTGIAKLTTDSKALHGLDVDGIKSSDKDGET